MNWALIDQGRSLVYVTTRPILIVSNQAAAGDKRKKVKDKGMEREGEDEDRGGTGARVRLESQRRKGKDGKIESKLLKDGK